MKSTATILVRAACSALLFWALAGHPYSYYTILRWATCVVCAYLAYVASKQDKTGWVWAFGALALLFNPVVPIHLDRDMWKVIDVGTGALMLVSIVFIREKVAAKSLPE